MSEIQLSDIGLDPLSTGANITAITYNDPAYDDPETPTQCTIMCEAVIVDPEYASVSGVDIRTRNRMDIALTITIAEIEAVGGKSFANMTRTESREVVRQISIMKIATALGVELPE